MSYIPEIAKLRSENEKKSFVYTVVIYVILLLLMFFYQLSKTHKVEVLQGGILIDFGNSADGLGTDNSSMGTPSNSTDDTHQASEPEPVEAAAPSKPVPQPTASKPEVMTQNSEEIALAKKKKEEEKKKQQELLAEQKRQQEEAKKKAAEEAARKKKEAEEQAFKDKIGKGIKGSANTPGSGGSADGKGEGSTRPGGNQGDPNGVPGAPKGDGNPGTGGGDGVSFSLNGRKILQKPAINDDSQRRGTVVIKIKVDKRGKVIGAEYQQSGSNTNDAYLIDISKKAAYKAVFNADPNAADEQFGTITFKYVVQ